MTTNALQAVASAPDFQAIEKVLINGDLSPLTPSQRVSYYNAVCQSLGLNPLTRPFDYIRLNNKLVLYAKKDATDQLRMNRGVSITRLAPQCVEDLYVVTADAQDRDGRTDSATGAVCIAGLSGEAKANAMMKAETKAKRRVTLSICGLGMTDETEVVSIEGAKPVQVDANGEIVGEAVPTRTGPRPGTVYKGEPYDRDNGGDDGGHEPGPTPRTVTRVEEKLAGKTTYYLVTFADGFEAGTRDRAIALQAEHAKDDGLFVDVTTEATAKGGQKIVELVLLPKPDAPF